MKWLIRVVLALVVLALAFVGIGFLLPSQFHVERSVVINAPAEKVYALIADPREWKRWTVWNQRDPAMKIEYAGPPSGVGAKWSWQSKTEGNGEMEFTEATPPNRLGYRLSFPEFGMQSKGLLRVVPDGAGVRVSWSNEGDMGSNPLNRWFGLMMDRLVGPDFEGGLANLKRLAESS
ncbi:MAG: SRPBCC family protein [Burkholderiaceae bacterium]|nr:SRPBCC family protein [Burkholderiaceae bacterium]